MFLNSIFATNEPMAEHTTFKAGGEARYFAEPKNKDELINIMNCIKENHLDYFIMGNGSNVLVKDSGFDGVVVKIGTSFDGISFNRTSNDSYIVASGAGIMLSKVAKCVAEHSLTGMEALAGIPGSVGGAVAMNAGAYGTEIKDIIVSATVMDTSGSIFKLKKDELDLSYRHSIVQDMDYIVLEAEFELKKGNSTEISDKMQQYSRQRREKQPLEYPSAGSTFKRPEGYFAGKLIEDAGLRGYRLGGAQVSEKHCGFVINRDKATATDILAVIEHVQNKVKEQFGVELELEVKVLG